MYMYIKNDKIYIFEETNQLCFQSQLKTKLDKIRNKTSLKEQI